MRRETQLTPQWRAYGNDNPLWAKLDAVIARQKEVEVEMRDVSDAGHRAATNRPLDLRALQGARERDMVLTKEYLNLCAQEEQIRSRMGLSD
jgi:hypothetical protein